MKNSPHLQVENEPCTILVADDDEINQVVLKKFISAMGHRPIIVSNGRAVLEYCDRSHPDVILLDMMMPQMNGMAVLKELRNRMSPQFLRCRNWPNRETTRRASIWRGCESIVKFYVRNSKKNRNLNSKLPIPLSARIITLADVYDALTSERCYKKAFSHEESSKILLKDSGMHFDPDIMEAFIKVEDRFYTIKNSYRDND